METLQPTVAQQPLGSVDCGFNMLASMEHYLKSTAAAGQEGAAGHDFFLKEFGGKDVMNLRSYIAHVIYLGARQKKQVSQSRLDTIKVGSTATRSCVFWPLGEPNASSLNEPNACCSMSCKCLHPGETRSCVLLLASFVLYSLS
jgi:hypothetical protein